MTEHEQLYQALDDVATAAMDIAHVDPDTAAWGSFYVLVDRLSTACGALAPLNDGLTAHALRGGFAAVESALYSKDGVEVRNVAALIYLAFQGVRYLPEPGPADCDMGCIVCSGASLPDPDGE